MSFTQEQIDGYMTDTLDEETALQVEEAVGGLPSGGRVEDLIVETQEPESVDAVDDSIPSVDDNTDTEEEERQKRWFEAQEEEKDNIREEEAAKRKVLEEQLEKERKAKDEFSKLAEKKKEIDQSYSSIDPDYTDDNTKLLTEKLKQAELKIQEIESNQIKNSTDPRVDEYFRKQELDEERRKRSERDKTIINSLKELSEDAPELALDGGLDKTYNEYMEFVEGISGKFNLVKNGVVDDEKLTRIESAYVDGIDGGEVRKIIDESGVKVPDDLSKFLKLTDFYNRSRGIAYDRTTGKKKSFTLSPKDIYWLQNKDRILADARKKESLKIQEKLHQRQNAAVTLTPGETISDNNEAMNDVQWYNTVGDNAQQVEAWRKTKDPRYDKLMDIEKRIGNGEFRNFRM